jgi:site-specific DNA-methyltransferase (adenine-specific)
MSENRLLTERRLDVNTDFDMQELQKNQPGQVRDAIVRVLSDRRMALPISAIEQQVVELIGPTPSSSVRSYLNLNTPGVFVREERGVYRLADNYSLRYQPELHVHTDIPAPYRWGKSELYLADCLDWLADHQDCSLHAVVTDPPYGLLEYSPEQQLKLRNGNGGVWRIPPSFDGTKRSPLPRFTTLTPAQVDDLYSFFQVWGEALVPCLVPGANVVVASNPLLSYVVAAALARAGLERRGEVIRLVMTMRGGDRPKAAHEEFSGVSVMPRSMWEPWLVFRKPLEGRAQDNLRKWKTGGFRRPSPDRPFGDVIKSAPTRKAERSLAPHPSLKPQAFLRELVRAVLPLGEGVILDPFAGAGSTLAAAEHVGYKSIGVEKDQLYFDIACEGMSRLAQLQT